MAADTKIEWCQATFNPWRGCTKVSPGCANCYAETLSGRNPDTLGVWGPNGTRVVASESMWKQPLKWEGQQRLIPPAHPDRPRVLCASLADVFEDWQGPMKNAAGEVLFRDTLKGGPWTSGYTPIGTPDRSPGAFSMLTMQDVRARLFALIDATPNLDWLLLTKRPENVAKMTTCWPDNSYPKNVWLGTSVENQQTADERIPHLLKTPAAVRFLSCEPLLGPVDIDKGRRSWLGSFAGTVAATGEKRWMPGIDWCIVGGESGPGARPCNVAWVRSIVEQCRSAGGVACFVKQMGAVPQTRSNSFDERDMWTLPLRDKKGGDPAEWPSDLRVREFPKVTA